MKTSFKRLYDAHAAFGRYAAIKFIDIAKKKEPQEVPQNPPAPPVSRFAEINYLVDQPNSFNTGFVEYVFSEWLRTLSMGN